MVNNKGRTQKSVVIIRFGWFSRKPDRLMLWCLTNGEVTDAEI